MKIWTDKDGNKLDWKEFKERYNKGKEAITPVQSLETNVFFQQIMTLGFFLGLCVTLYNWKTSWWLAIILFGGLGLNITQLKSLRKQLKTLRAIEKTLRDDRESSDTK
jgi:putative Mn2+ efflux pump MntP